MLKTKNKDKVLITGCGGMLGQAIYQESCRRYLNVFATDIDLNETWLNYFDVRDLEQAEDIFSSIKPNLVLHLAALTDLEYCEENPKDAWLTNALGTENIALLAQKYNSTFVYISTAGIFDGKQDNYNEFDTPKPLSFYGKSKYYGEKFVEDYLQKYFIFRAGWMMGGGLKKDKKFINKLYKQIKACKKTLHVVNDKIGIPTYTNNFANSIFKIIDKKYYGLYHQVCDSDYCIKINRLDIAKKFINFLGLENEIEIKEVSSEYFKKEYFAPRPASEKLVNLKSKARNIHFMNNWEQCLEEYARVFKDDYFQKI